MALKKEIAAKIKDLLQQNPKGLSISDIVRKIDINRNTAGRYLVEFDGFWASRNATFWYGKNLQACSTRSSFRNALYFIRTYHAVRQ